MLVSKVFNKKYTDMPIEICFGDDVRFDGETISDALFLLHKSMLNGKVRIKLSSKEDKSKFEESKPINLEDSFNIISTVENSINKYEKASLTFITWILVNSGSNNYIPAIVTTLKDKQRHLVFFKEDYYTIYKKIISPHITTHVVFDYNTNCALFYVRNSEDKLVFAMLSHHINDEDYISEKLTEFLMEL